MANRVRINPSFHRKGEQAFEELHDALVDEVTDRTRAIRRDNPVRTGRMRAAWRVMRTARGVRLTNSVPYASYIVERYNLLRRLARDALATGLRRRVARG